jgi:hypothetical protein
MCLVIDVNAISKVFDPRNAEHDRFRPVALWVTSGSGSVIYGGTRYLKELGEGRYLRLFTELLKARRAVRIDTRAVDDLAVKLKIKVPDKNFDDEHIVALVGLSRCCLVCTDDTKSLPYIRRSDLYPPGVKVPYIYRSLKHRKHCCSRLLVEVCPRRVAQSKGGKKPKSRPTVEALK